MSPVDPGVTAAAIGGVVGAQFGPAAGVAAASLVQQINVNIDGLAKAAQVMREELKEGYRTQVPHVYGPMEEGSTIGTGIPGPEWDTLRDRYGVCIEATCMALENLDLGTTQMAGAAERIAKNYRDADELSRATVSDVREAFVPPTDQAAAPAQPGAGR